MTDMPADRHIDLERRFAAPRATVFAAFTEPEQIAQWWGPHGFEAPLEKVAIDLRPGGRLEVIMVVASEEIAAGMGVPLGTEFPDRSEIVDVVVPELLVLRHDAQPEVGLPVEARSRIEFHTDEDGTRVVFTGGPYTPAMAPNAEAGWSQQFDKLDHLLAR